MSKLDHRNKMNPEFVSSHTHTYSSCFCTMTSALFPHVTLTSRHEFHSPCKSPIAHLLVSSWHRAHKNAFGEMASGSVWLACLWCHRRAYTKSGQNGACYIPACTRPQHCDTSMAHLAQTTNRTLKLCLVCELKHCLWCLDWDSLF